MKFSKLITMGTILTAFLTFNANAHAKRCKSAKGVKATTYAVIAGTYATKKAATAAAGKYVNAGLPGIARSRKASKIEGLSGGAKYVVVAVFVPKAIAQLLVADLIDRGWKAAHCQGIKANALNWFLLDLQLVSSGRSLSKVGKLALLTDAPVTGNLRPNSKGHLLFLLNASERNKALKLESSIETPELSASVCTGKVKRSDRNQEDRQSEGQTLLRARRLRFLTAGKASTNERSKTPRRR